MKKLQKLDINLFKSFEIESPESTMGGQPDDYPNTQVYCTSATGADHSDTNQRHESDFLKDGFSHRTNVFEYTTNEPYQ